jgi:hypothetical protein
MDPRNDEPFDRGPWRKLLGADSGAPTKDMDRRILAEARRALTPRINKWWLPASLAASLLLAVLIVQWQLADSGAPAHVTESDVPAVPALGDDNYLSAPQSDSDLPSPSMEASPDAAADAATPLIVMPVLESRSAPRAESPAAVIAAPAAAEPESERRDQALMRERSSTDGFTGDAAKQSAVAPAPPPETPAPSPAQAEESSGALGNLSVTGARKAEARSPEAWYAEIEALRAAGHVEQAEAELLRFKAAHPGWIEQHRQQNKKQ